MHRSILFSLLFCAVASPALAEDGPDFTSEVRPIIARHCLKCHGPDDAAREGKLRLDVVDAERVAAKSGGLAIVPGRTDRGTLLKRIFSADPDEVMPPPATKNPLTDGERQTLKRWIAAGAVYKQHWAFIPPVQVAAPAVHDAGWPKNPIDNFILARLEAEGLHPSPPADRYTLIRRVYLDLIGLPPTPDEVDAFIADGSPDAYEKVVDRLLANPHYGERWARRWLDLARYSDTNGYEKDRTRSIWPYRDWVINALNADMPFDEFTIEQIAGDMLPNATLEQKIATGFHRNTMLNEEGGIDPQEFRWKAVIDRNNTTATTWLGLTLGCAQCHTHKFDPIPQREYYQMMAFLNNADEPVMAVPTPEITAKREAIEKEIAARVTELPDKFPLPGKEPVWTTPRIVQVVSEAGATAKTLPDSSILIGGTRPERDSYTIIFDTDSQQFDEIRLEVLPDPSLPHDGPGRAANGNFVVSHLSLAVAPAGSNQPAADVKLMSAEADFSQKGFPVEGAIRAETEHGWAIDGPGGPSQHTAIFHFAPPASAAGGARWTLRFDQTFGNFHTLGHFRLSFGRTVASPAGEALAALRHQALQKSFDAWIARESARAVKWTVLRPTQMKGNVALLHLVDDGSVFVSGDQSKRDVYDLILQCDLPNITAVRLEALPDERLPAGGPGRIYYEGTPGNFFLSAMTLAADGKPVAFSHADQTFADGKNSAAGAIDDDPLSGWSISGGEGQAQTAVFQLATPLAKPGPLALSMVFEKYYSAPLGRFRISVTSDPRPIAAPKVSSEVEEILLADPSTRTKAQTDQLFQYFLTVVPELSAENKAIAALRNSLPKYPTTLVFTEHGPQETRPTFIHHRGEYLQPTEQVQPNVLSILPPLPAGAAHDRLSFARWLVAKNNPLTARVIINRQWAAFFGTGIVSTLGDFGYQGETPSHPQLLDWLAVEFMNRGWSFKQMDRLIVTSATYQQSSDVTPELLDRDPHNRLLARGPRFRIDAELVRDYALRVSGLLSEKIGGPSVFPPQPASVTTEGAYRPFDWVVSTGEDRYRRGLYTFSKRTAPFAMFEAFDAPTGEACIARRDVSDSPLQALTLLNSEAFVEAAQALGKVISEQGGDENAKVTLLFRRCLCRLPSDDERSLVVNFYEAQKQRLDRGELDAAKIAGPGGGDANERAAWTVTARMLLNLDETITKS
jgi:hypothetical protein